jgi:hypothetical protein
MPILGTTWRVNLDCTGQPAGLGWLYGYDRSSSGTMIPGSGEILVDTNSRRLFRVLISQSGNSVPISVAIPNNVALCGARAFVQGACSSRSQVELTNALDIVMGF